MNYWLISAKALYTWHRGVESILQPSCLPTLINLLLPSSFPFLPFPMPFFGRTETEPLFSPSHIHFSVLFLPSSFFIIFFFHFDSLSHHSSLLPLPFLLFSFFESLVSSPRHSFLPQNATLCWRKGARVFSCIHKGKKFDFKVADKGCPRSLMQP